LEKGVRGDWVSQRSNEVRPAAIRALILYPMNALVEDQLTRIRKALESDEAKKWLTITGRETGFTSGDIRGLPLSQEIRALK